MLSHTRSYSGKIRSVTPVPHAQGNLDFTGKLHPQEAENISTQCAIHCPNAIQKEAMVGKDRVVAPWKTITQSSEIEVELGRQQD